MPNANYPNEPDFNEALKAWDAPAVPASLDQRVFASYHEHLQRAPFWKRWITASIRVPAPLAAAAALLFLIAGGVALAALKRTPAQTAVMPNPGVTTITKTEIVEVPVVKERVVTRVVYVEKPASAPALHAAQLLGTSQPREIKLASHVAGDNAYTNVDLSGFQPVEEMTVRIIKGSTANER
jgi:hypothetical protein